MGKEKASKSAKTDEQAGISKSKAKREARRKQVQKAKREAHAARITGIALTAVIVIALAVLIGRPAVYPWQSAQHPEQITARTYG